jgi:protein-tyrosine phosphatase
LTQVTASSVTGDFGKKVKKFTFQLLENNLTHFVASDAHNVSTRNFKLREAYGVVEREFGIDLVYMLQENCEIMVEGNTVFKEMPQRIKDKRFFGLFG